MLHSSIDDVDYLSLSRREEPLSNTDNAFVAHQVAMADQDMDTLGQDIASLSKRVTDLRIQLAQLSAQKDKCSSLSTPIRRLPNIVLARIFKHVCQSGISLVHSPKSFEIPPLILSHVCYKWRSVVQMPANGLLWSSITLDLTRIPSSLPFLQLATMQDLDLAVSHVLSMALPEVNSHPETYSLSIVIRADEATDPPRPVCRLFRYMDRWRHAELYVHQKYFAFKDWITTPSILQHLVLHLTGKSFSLQDDVTIFSNADKLTELDFQDMDYHVDTTVFAFRWEKLKRLTLSGALLEQVFEILPKLQTELSYLKLDVVDRQYEEDMVAHIHTTFANLRTLVLGCLCWSPEVYKALFDATSAPNLTSLSLQAPLVPKSQMKVLGSPSSCLLGLPYIKFLKRSSSSLQWLSIRGVVINETTLVTSLLSLNRLTKLYLAQHYEQTFPNISEVFVAALAVDKDGPNLLPKLENLELKTKMELLEPFKALVSSRQIPGINVTLLKRAQFNTRNVLHLTTLIKS